MRTGVQKEVCSPGLETRRSTAPQQNRRERGWEGGVVWVAVFSIRRESKWDGDLGPTDLGLVFLLCAQLRPGVPRIPDPGVWHPQVGQPGDLPVPGAEAPGAAGHPRSGSLQRSAQGVRVHSRRGEGGRRRCGMSLSGPAAGRFSFASSSDHGKTPFDLSSDILALNS